MHRKPGSAVLFFGLREDVVASVFALLLILAGLVLGVRADNIFVTALFLLGGGALAIYISLPTLNRATGG